MIVAANDIDPMTAAFYALAFDSGARRSELLGLTWPHVDVEAGTITIAQQLEPFEIAFAETKTKNARTITINADTVRKLGLHRKRQREIRMANRLRYKDHDLVFAEDTPVSRVEYGEPCRRLADRVFEDVVKAADVRRIKFHGIRHTTATLLLNAGVPVHVVSHRLGHASAVMTLDVYSHALVDAQLDATAKLAAVLS